MSAVLKQGKQSKENFKHTITVPGEGQICQCLRKGPLCSAWCHLLLPLPPWLLHCLRSYLAAKLQAN